MQSTMNVYGPGTGAQVLQRIEDALKTLQSNYHGASLPTTELVAGMSVTLTDGSRWVRNAANNDWVAAGNINRSDRRITGAFAPHEAATPNMTVVLDPGAVMSGTTLTEKAQQSTATIAAPVSNPRIDRIVIDAATGMVSVIAGTEAVSPAPPALTSGKLPVAQVLLATTTTAITNSMITDERLGSGGSSVGFPSGTRMSFNQTNAPTGWTKDVTAALNDSILRIVTGAVGAGGSQAFSTWNGLSATGAHTLTTAELPAHNHAITDPGHKHNASASSAAGSWDYSQYIAAATVLSGTNTVAIQNATTGISVQNTGSGTAHTHPLSNGIKYNDFIIASKD